MSGAGSPAARERDVDKVFEALPADGSAVVAALAVRRSGLRPERRGWAALLQLCAERRAVVKRIQGASFARRGPGGQAEMGDGHA